MKKSPSLSTSSLLFEEFLHENLADWERMIGYPVRHTRFGMGEISNVELRAGSIPLVTVRFDDNSVKPNLFNADSFREAEGERVLFCTSIPQGLMGRFRHWKKYASRRLEFETWSARLIEELRSSAEPRVELTREIEAPRPSDLELCLEWIGEKSKEDGSANHRFRAHLERNEYETLRMWSARAAENAALTFFGDLGCYSVDVSIVQLSAQSDAWLTHDIEAGDVPYDVKNSRRSLNSPSSYVSHVIPRFKEDRDRRKDVHILGVLSDYKTRGQLREADWGCALMLGTLSTSGLGAFVEAMQSEFGEYLDTTALSRPRPTLYSGWLFDFPPEWMTGGDDSKENTSRLLEQCPDPTRVGRVVPPVVCAMFAGKSFSAQKYLAQDVNWRVEELKRIVEIAGFSRRTVFGWCLGRFVKTILSSESEDMVAEVNMLREILTFSGSEEAKFGFHDPLFYVENLLQVLEKVGGFNRRSELKKYVAFRLVSSSTLKGILTNGLEQTVIAYCGGWDLEKNAPCGTNPIHLGQDESCEHCGFLICHNCGHCSQDCLDSNKPKRRERD